MLISVVLIACFLPNFSNSVTVNQLKREVLDKILPKSENDVFLAPDDATVVETSLHVLDVDDINEKDMEFTLTLYFRHSWKDWRLQYLPNDRFDFVTINDDDAIWTPDTFFVNQKQGHGFDQMRPNVRLKIFPDGTVTISKKISVTLMCPMDFTRFPFDNQKCSTRVESYGSDVHSILLKWKDHSAITVSKKLYIPLLMLTKIASSSGTVGVSTGEYSFLKFDFFFSRQLTYYIYQVYLPSILLVALSWVPFWMKRKLTAKLLVGVGVLVVYAMNMSRFFSKQPKVSYATSMMHFAWICLVFIVAALVLHALSKEQPSTKIIENGKLDLDDEKKKKRARLMRLGSRLVLPVAFVLVCVVYFGTAVDGFTPDDPLEVPANQTSQIIVN